MKALAHLTAILIVTTAAAIDFIPLPETGWKEDFSSFEGTHASLPYGMSVSKDGEGYMAADDSDFRGIDDGNLGTGGCYAWSIGDDRALGYQPSLTEFTSGFFEASFSNSSERTYRFLKIEYDVVSLNNEDRSSSLTLQIVTDLAAVIAINDTEVVTKELEDSNPEWQRTRIRQTVKLVTPITPARTFRLRWYGDDVSGSGSRDEYGIDNIHICGIESIGTVVTLR